MAAESTSFWHRDKVLLIELCRPKEGYTIRYCQLCDIFSHTIKHTKKQTREETNSAKNLQIETFPELWDGLEPELQPESLEFVLLFKIHRLIAV